MAIIEDGKKKKNKNKKERNYEEQIVVDGNEMMKKLVGDLGVVFVSTTVGLAASVVAGKKFDAVVTKWDAEINPPVKRGWFGRRK